MPWTPEQAKENARKGGLARAEKARIQRLKSVPEVAKELLENAAPQAARVLIALLDDPDDGPKLTAKEKADIAKLVLQYGIGKPHIAKPNESDPEDADESPEGGGQVVAFGVRQEAE